MRILFICSFGLHRSRTAEFLYKDRYETKSAGLHNEERPVTKENVDWADKIIVMDSDQKFELELRYPEAKKKIVSIDIPNIYSFNQPELITLLKSKLKNIL
ncbi:MAG TPA: phosphotyrosine protein phosphatase [Candidatus Nanoarchaeia archaeon]|nr:phosphotyrosine protein phosphatase [Candidatus Nanoarchaeia archaeon]